MKLKVVEVFDSIQGEGDWMGTYCTFIRLPGCNYACPFCDTVFSRADVVLDTDDVIHRPSSILNMRHHVVITGGEPSIHPQITKLIQTLQAMDHYVHIETNGTDITRVSGANWITVSPKRQEWLKTSEEPNWYKAIGSVNELKLVVDEQFDPEDWLQLSYPGHIWLQPCDGPDIEKSKKYIMEIVRMYPGAFRAGIQLHKYYEVI